MKRFTAMIVAIALCISLIPFASAVSVAEIAYYEGLIAQQENAVSASELLNQAFGFDEDGNIQFPVDYAGMWIDGSELVVALTDITETNLEKYKDYVGVYVDCVRFESAEYSYFDLVDTADNIVSDLENCDYDIHISEYYISERDNEVVIEVTEDSCSIIAGLPSFQDYECPVRFEVVEMDTSIDETLSEDEVYNTFSDITYDLSGGNVLYNVMTDKLYTLSCCGTYGGNPAILTCGHVKQGLNNLIRKSNSSGTRYGPEIGLVAYHQFANNENGDFEIIVVSNTALSTTNIVADSYAVKGAYSDVPTGTTVKFYGQSTGYVGYGTVDQRNIQDFNSGTSISPKGYSRIKVLNGGCEEGDSGGPVFADRSTGGVNFCGVIGAKRLISGYLYIYFTPYTYIYTAGFSVKVI